MDRKKQVVQILRDVKGVVSYQQSCTIAEYPGAESLDRFLASQWPQRVLPEDVVHTDSAPQNPVPATGRLTSAKGSDQKNIVEIASEISDCVGCGLAEQRPCVVAGQGHGENIRLMIVGHWLEATQETGNVFGIEEDQMLRRMLAAIHLPQENVFITNVIKCVVMPGGQPKAEHIDACSSYLIRQIKAVAPELICAMGMIATKSLLRRPQSLSQLRGQFHTFRSGEGVEIPLLPTYHPGYLLQNPEMKQATWQDLQLLQKRLALS